MKVPPTVDLIGQAVSFTYDELCVFPVAAIYRPQLRQVAQQCHGDHGGHYGHHHSSSKILASIHFFFRHAKRN